MTDFKKNFPVPVRSVEELLRRLEDEQTIGWHGVSKTREEILSRYSERQRLFMELVQTLERLYEEDEESNMNICSEEEEYD
jgi:alkylated DNA nucleotide flippase Atl1